MHAAGLTPPWPLEAWLDQAPQRALVHLNEALGDALARGDAAAAVHARVWQGRMQDELGLPDAAQTLDTAALEAQRLNDPVLVTYVAITLACVEADHARHARALAACRQASAQARALRVGALIRQALHTSATSLCHVGEHDQAVETFEEARASLLADPAGPLPDAQVALARYAAGQAQAWLMRGGLLLEASGPEAAGPALQQARALGEQACGGLAGASARHSHPALFTLIRVLLELNEGDRAREWLARVQAECPAPAAPGSLALAQLVLSESMIALRLGTNDIAAVLSRLQWVEDVRHPRVTGGDLRLSLLRCLFEACEHAGHYRQALAYQQQWSLTKARVRTQLAHEHRHWSRDTLAALRAEADAFVTHELRAPLAVAVGSLQSLPAQGHSGATVASLRRAEHSVRRAMDIADQYLNVIRAEQLRREDLGPIDLTELVDDVCEQMAAPAGDPVQLERELEAGVHIQGDRILLMRALANLMSNAFKHAPPGSSVRVTMQRVEAGVRLCVADRGPGLPLDMRVRLFQRFATGAVRKGNGLGLAMVARVARVHDARIEVDSAPGQGTTVAITLPDRAIGVA
jgi:signal transduction histidine kinase